MQSSMIQPFCDKHRSPMSLKQFASEVNGSIEFLNSYACDSGGCSRCYGEDEGYFDFIGGEIRLSDRQTLCEGDGCPMFLELGLFDGDDIWQCPCCGNRVRF